MAIDQIITDLPTPPSSGDPVNFRTRADAFVAALVTFVTQLNLFSTQANDTETNINAKEASAVGAANIASAAANFQGEWTSKGYTLGQSVSSGGTTYMCKLTHATGFAVTNTTYWQPTGLAAIINGSAAKTTLVDADLIGLADSAASFSLKQTEWGNIKTALGLIFATIASPIFSGSISAKNAMYKGTPVTVTSWSYVTTTITLNVASHTFVAGDYIEVGGLTATTNIPNGVHLVTSVTGTTIVFTSALTPTGTAGVLSATVKGYIITNGRIEAIGVGQTWQNVTASRVSGTTYTNSTGKPILVIVDQASTSSDVGVYVNGINIMRQRGTAGVVNYPFVFIVPNSSTYSATSPSLYAWHELR